MTVTGSAADVAQMASTSPGGPDNLLAEPAEDHARVVGGLLGVAGGEAWQGARGGFENNGLVAHAMLDLCRSYVEHSPSTPLEVARIYEGIPAPAWLLPVAIVHPHKHDVLADTLELAIAGGVPRASLSACVAYVELAWELFAGRSVSDAVRTVTGQPLSPPSSGPPLLCGMAPVDALTAAIWALGQPGKLRDLAASLIHYTEPWVAAAAAGVLGVRDGCVNVPAQWFRCVSSADLCLGLARPLLGARDRGSPPHHRHLATAT